jgi:tetratricopeptide (TPR) repeat protein
MTMLIKIAQTVLWLIPVFCSFLPIQTYAQASTDNTELQKMADDDQQARMTSNIDWKLLNQQDSMRRVRVFELLKEKKVVTAKDHFNAGIVFQHGLDTIASAMAVKSFANALRLDSTLNPWWYAAAVDRNLMWRKEPQIYGTQFTRSKEGKWILYEMDTTQISDAQRKYHRVGTYAEQQEKAKAMNLKTIAAYYYKNGSIDSTLDLIRAQYNKGNQAEYKITEEDVNSFGYELLSNNKNDEALKIFRLNTILYPKGYNTFDSYGEVLLKLGNKTEAVKAYRRSLELNPENENAKKILAELN